MRVVVKSTDKGYKIKYKRNLFSYWKTVKQQLVYADYIHEMERLIYFTVTKYVDNRDEAETLLAKVEMFLSSQTKNKTLYFNDELLIID